ncbi:hypothetical protein EJ04DRAFT_10575 [Polyplosphaeria fusca]|uniref:Uncharacterized protein n=1 Tax=Polyplosphaeria fusca TaxID=682080 RepID=A0A9P4QUK8_9PLEO|nr:hypothetical protein EJ04DRAFT_10575 [Polyplosphaeria fusca]
MRLICPFLEAHCQERVFQYTAHRCEAFVPVREEWDSPLFRLLKPGHLGMCLSHGAFDIHGIYPKDPCRRAPVPKM